MSRLLSAFHFSLLLGALFGSVATSVSEACAIHPQTFLHGRAAVPRDVRAECGTVWKQWTHDAVVVHHEHYAWLEMWSVDATNKVVAPQIERIILGAGYAVTPQEDTREHLFSDAVTYLKSKQRGLLVVHLFGVGQRIYIVMGGQ